MKYISLFALLIIAFVVGCLVGARIVSSFCVPAIIFSLGYLFVKNLSKR
nr:MAG TPA: hypothetical protein [Bacteriophage sp.]